MRKTCHQDWATRPPCNGLSGPENLITHDTPLQSGEREKALKLDGTSSFEYARICSSCVSRPVGGKLHCWPGSWSQAAGTISLRPASGTRSCAETNNQLNDGGTIKVLSSPNNKSGFDSPLLMCPRKAKRSASERNRPMSALVFGKESQKVLARLF
jgi:hypothetical protein